MRAEVEDLKERRIKQLEKEVKEERNKALTEKVEAESHQEMIEESHAEQRREGEEKKRWMVEEEELSNQLKLWKDKHKKLECEILKVSEKCN